MERDTVVNYLDGAKNKRVSRDVEEFDPSDFNNVESNEVVDGNLENDINVNFSMAESGNRIPRDVEVFNPEDFNDNNRKFCEDKSKWHDVEVIDDASRNEGNNLENDLKVNEGIQATRIPRDVEVFDPASL